MSWLRIPQADCSLATLVLEQKCLPVTSLSSSGHGTPEECASVAEQLFEHAADSGGSQSADCSGDANQAHDAWVARFGVARLWSHRKAVRRERKPVRRMRSHRNLPLRAPDGLMTGPLSHVGLPRPPVPVQRCLGQPGGHEPPDVEVCGSESAAQVVAVKPVRTWKTQSHRR